MSVISPSENELLELIKLINEFSGIDLMENKNTLAIKLKAFFNENSFRDFREFLLRLRYDKALKQSVLDVITVNETYFYRELAQLKDAVFYIKSLNKPTSVLCAPCSSGEEVYSFAILSHINLVKNLHITGVDINQQVIEEAKLGNYQGRSLHRLGESEKKHYFNKNGDVYSVKKENLCHCRFELCNVFDDKFLKLGKFDLILSRNMMIYFDHESRLRLMKIFHKISNANARLYVGNSDLVPENEYFTKVFAPKGLSYYLRNN